VSSDGEFESLDGVHVLLDWKKEREAEVSFLEIKELERGNEEKTHVRRRVD